MELRAYSVVNMYLKGIQAGIQAAHSQTELCMQAIKQNVSEKNLLRLLQWHRYPTMILKNGGDSDDMRKFLSIVDQCDYPQAAFYESGLGGALTSITVILPDINVTTKRIIHNGCDMGRPELDALPELDQRMITTLNKMRSAT